MRSKFEASSLVPPELVVESVLIAADRMLNVVGARRPSATCPTCGVEAARIRSGYRRQAQDLLCSGKCVRLQMYARRLFCDALDCGVRIFAE